MHQEAILLTVMDGSLKSGAKGRVGLVLPLLSQPYMKPVWPKQLVGTVEFPKNILLTWTSQSNMLLTVVTMEGRFCLLNMPLRMQPKPGFFNAFMVVAAVVGHYRFIEFWSQKA